MNTRFAILAIVAALTAVLSGCSNDFDMAIARGCDGLRAAAAAYAADDRSQVEAAKDDAEYLGMAAELTDTIDDREKQQDASAAALGFNALYSAAYEPAEANNGAEIWQGKKLDAERKTQLAAGLAACQGYGQ